MVVVDADLTGITDEARRQAGSECRRRLAAPSPHPLVV